MSEDSLPYDPRYWHSIQPPEEMEVSRHFEYDEDALLQLKKWLRLDEPDPKTVVEVGCGSGYFTEKLVKMASNLKELVAIEPDDILRDYAKAKAFSKVRFLKGTAENIPLPDQFADLTACHIVLNNLPDVHQAVAEMTRVTKGGGILATIEPFGGSINYYPDPRLNELEEKISQAYGKGVWDLRSKLIDYSKDLERKRSRYPEVFYSCGLVNVEVHGILSAFLLSDPRRDREEILRWLERWLSFHEQDWGRMREILQRGGLSEPLIQEYYEAKKAYLENLVKHPEQIPKTHELQTASRIVTVGFKSERR